MSKSLILIRGIPESGKNTFALMLNTKAICTADDYFTSREGKYNWKLENAGKAHSWCQKKCKRFMQIGVEKIVVANTLTTEKELYPYFDLAKKYDYRVFSVIIENRHNGKNNHNVPEETIQKMKDRFEILL